MFGVSRGKVKLRDDEAADKKWCARRDSNSRPNAPEAFALSS